MEIKLCCLSIDLVRRNALTEVGALLLSIGKFIKFR
jgi:hypothetical protein